MTISQQKKNGQAVKLLFNNHISKNGITLCSQFHLILYLFILIKTPKPFGLDCKALSNLRVAYLSRLTWDHFLYHLLCTSHNFFTYRKKPRSVTLEQVCTRSLLHLSSTLFSGISHSRLRLLPTNQPPLQGATWHFINMYLFIVYFA